MDRPPPASETLCRRVAGWVRGFRYHGREGIWLTREMARAKRAQQLGDPRAMRLALAEAARIAGKIRGNRSKFASGWKAVIEHELALFDIPAASRTAGRAVGCGLPEAQAAAANVESIAAETQAWNDVVAAAGATFLGNETRGDALVVLLPSTAFGLDTPTEPSLRKGLRFIFGEVIATCRERSIPFEVRGRLANHGTPEVEAGRRYVSHHSLGPDGRGLHIKATDRPSCFSFDTFGYSGWSKFAQTPLEQLGMSEVDPDGADFLLEKERIIRGNVSKYQQTAAGTDLPAEYVFVGLQKPGDAVQQLARMPMLGMLEEVVTTCQARGMAVVVKRHPKCTSGAVARELAAGVAAGRYQVSDASIHDLIAGSCAVCVVNSSVGAEALLHEKPVYLFGAAEYQHVCYRVETRGEFAQIFRPYELPVPPNTLRRFLHLLRHEYAVDVTDPASAKAYIRRKVLAHAAR